MFKKSKVDRCVCVCVRARTRKCWSLLLPLFLYIRIWGSVAGGVTRQRSRLSGVRILSGISKSSRPPLGPTPSSVQSVQVFFFSEGNDPFREADLYNLHLFPRLDISGSIPLLSSYAFVAWTEESYTGLYKMIVGVLTTSHTQYTWDRCICIFLFNRTILQVFVTYLTGALYVHPLWFYKHQHENRVHSKLFVAWQHVAFSLSFATILVNCASSREMHNYCTLHIIKENFENFLIHWCKYILLSEVYCVWQVVKTLAIILNNPVLTN